MALKLAALGANVIAVGQTQSKLDSLKSDTAAKERIETIQVNLGNWNETQAKLGDLCNRIDFLVNNAGYSHNCTVDQVPEDELNRVLDVNLKAPINMIRLVATGMKKRRFGSIVNVSSVAGIAALDEHVSYAASKAALDMVTKVSAKELGPFNIRVNSVNPTVVWTKMGRDHWSDPEKQGAMTSRIPLGRFAEVDEVVEPIIFLLSNKSSMINGVMMPIDGGFVAT